MKYAVFSDVHGNYAALKAVLDHINITYGPAINYYLFAGDAIGQGPHPNEVCTMLRTIRKFVGIRGDNDAALLNDNTTGLDAETAATISWTKQVITKENRKFLEKLEEYAGIESDGFEILIVHGSPENLKTGAVYPNMTLDEMKRLFEKSGADIIITGHTHIPFVKQLDGKILFNAGSVGQPRDRDPRACYAFFDTATRQLVFHRVSYNINMTADSIRRSKMPEAFAERLYYGW